MAHLGGRVIACLEARYASELADLVTRHGGITYQAPCLREVHEPDAAETRLAVDLIRGRRLTEVVFLTGVGVQTIVEGARRLGQEAELVAGLAGKRIAVRGPKTHNAVRRLGLDVDLAAPEPFTSDTLLSRIETEWTLTGRTVLVQRYGAPVPAFTDGLRRLGAEVIEVSPYRWERPQDEEPVVRLIEDLAGGWIDVLAATSAAQVDHLFEIAQQRGHEGSLRESLARPGLRVAAQGVICASAFERRGIKVDLIPARASMGALIVEIANRVGAPTVTEPRPNSTGGSTVAVFGSADASRADIDRAVAGLDAESNVIVLADRSLSAEGRIEQACVERGLAVQRCRPARDAMHPADTMIRRAARVVIVAGEARGAEVRRVVRLAERYAKPVEVT